MNDESSDSTVQLIASHAIQKLISTRIITICNSGVSVARNTGIKAAKTALIAFLDADDELLPAHLEVALTSYIMRPDAVVYWSGIQRIFDNNSDACLDERGRLPNFNAISMRHAIEDLGDSRHLIGSSLFSDLIRGNFIQPSSSVVKRETKGELNLFNEKISFAEDRLFFLELLGKGEGVFSNIVTALVHRNGLNTSVTTDGSKSLFINGRVLLALECARSIESVAAHPERMLILSKCIETALQERIYYSSYVGLKESFRAFFRAVNSQDFRLASHPWFLLKSLLRAALKVLR